MDEHVDEKDRHILDILKEHGDYTTRQIAKKTLLPATTIHNRIKRMRESGVIQKFTIEANPRAIGKGFVAYVLISADVPFLKKHKKSQHDLARELRKMHFIERVDIVSGGADLVAIVAVKDVAEFDSVLLGKLQLLDGVEKTQSLIVIHSPATLQ